MTSHSFHQHLRTQAAPPPRTMREEEMFEIKQNEVRIDSTKFNFDLFSSLCRF